MLSSAEHVRAISRIRLACGPCSSGPRSMSLMVSLRPFAGSRTEPRIDRNDSRYRNRREQQAREPGCFIQRANGLRYRRLGRIKLGNGKLPELRNNPKKRAQSQPSGACCVRRTLGTPTNLLDNELQTYIGLTQLTDCGVSYGDEYTKSL